MRRRFDIATWSLTLTEINSKTDSVIIAEKYNELTSDPDHGSLYPVAFDCDISLHEPEPTSSTGEDLGTMPTVTETGETYTF